MKTIYVVAVFSLSAIIGIAVSVHPLWVVGVTGAGLVVWYLLKLDLWQVIATLTILLLAAASSNVDSLREAAFYPRYAAGMLLVLCTFLARPLVSPSRLDSWGLSTKVLLASMCLLAILALASTLWSITPTETIQQAVAWAIVVALVIGLVMRRWMTDEQISADLAAIFFAAVGTLALSILLNIGGLPMHDVNGRFAGIYSNPNSLGIVAALASAIGWGLFRHTRLRRYIPALAISLFCLLASGSRTSILALALGGLWVLVRLGVWSRVKLGFIAVSLLSVFLLLGQSAIDRLPSDFENTAYRFTPEGAGGTFERRTVAWIDTLDLWSSRPLLGFGFRTGQEVFVEAQASRAIITHVGLSHNSYLQVLLELGIVGFAFFVCALLSIAATCLKSSVKGLNGGLVAALVTGLLIQVSESAVFGTGSLFPWLFWPVAAVASRPAARETARRANGIPTPHAAASAEIVSL